VDLEVNSRSNYLDYLDKFNYKEVFNDMSFSRLYESILSLTNENKLRQDNILYAKEESKILIRELFQITFGDTKSPNHLVNPNLARSVLNILLEKSSLEDNIFSYKFRNF
jgi:hypothetical protein